MTEKPEASVLTARRAAQHVRLSSADDAYEHLYTLIVRSSLGPLHLMLADTPWPRGFGATLASVGTLSKGSRTVRCSPLCLVGYVRWDAQSDRFPPWPSSQARLLAPSPLRTVRNTFALHGSSTRKRPHEKRGRRLIKKRSSPPGNWLGADSPGDGTIQRPCRKLHQRLAPSSFA